MFISFNQQIYWICFVMTLLLYFVIIYEKTIMERKRIIRKENLKIFFFSFWSLICRQVLRDDVRYYFWLLNILLYYYFAYVPVFYIIYSALALPYTTTHFCPIPFPSPGERVPLCMQQSKCPYVPCVTWLNFTLRPLLFVKPTP